MVINSVIHVESQNTENNKRNHFFGGVEDRGSHAGKEFDINIISKLDFHMRLVVQNLNIISVFLVR